MVIINLLHDQNEVPFTTHKFQFDLKACRWKLCKKCHWMFIFLAARDLLLFSTSTPVNTAYT